MRESIRKILLELGEDPDREGLKETPERAARTLEFLTKGYKQDARKALQEGVFANDRKDMVLLRNVDFCSLCEHHLLPFFGKCHVAYVPDGRIAGLSKLACVVDIFSRRLQVQERLTRQVAETLQEVLRPQGAAVVMEARHLCMQMRGVEKQGSVAVTTALTGIFEKDSGTRAELMALIRGPLAGA